MTRYSNPLPQGQVPNAPGRPNAQQPSHPQHPQNPAGHRPPEPDLSGWPGAGVPRTGGRPAAAHSYSEPNPYADPAPYGDAQAPAHHDPYAALRPDGFGYQKPAADPYGLAGYTAPQPAPAPNAYARPALAPNAPAPQHAGYGAQHDPYASANGYTPAAQQPSAAHAPGSNGLQAQGYANAGHGFTAPQPSAPAPAAGYGAGYGAAPAAGYGDHWGGQHAANSQTHGAAQSLSVDGRDYGHGFGPADANGQAAWSNDGYGEPAFDPALGPPLGNGHANPAMGHGYAGAPPHQGASFDQSYAEDEGVYEDEPRRGNWKKIVGIVACTVLIGGVLTIAYSSIMGSNSGGPTPVIKGADGPAKVKPSDPGGKQFAHADSKIMGRLGEGGEETDVSGVRKVPVIAVGRDGSIQPPSATSAESEEQTRAVVAVPGLTVIDGLDGPSPTRPVGPKAEQKKPPVQMVTAEAPVVVNPPAKADDKPKKLVDTSREATAALPARDEQPAPPKKQKVVALDTAPSAPAGPKPTGAGYVAVLASVPASGSSRMDALAQFADMQQKYGAILTNKTPDIQEANLGEKGTYHRLLVGPPGSRDSANSVCTQLKAEGYSGCWVTAY
jgi:hypothetical protein